MVKGGIEIVVWRSKRGGVHYWKGVTVHELGRGVSGNRLWQC